MCHPSTEGGWYKQEFGANLDYMRPFLKIEALGGGQGGKGSRGLLDLSIILSSLPTPVI